MNFEHILYEQDSTGVARIILNRPHCLNSLNAAMHEELQHAIAAVRKDDSMRCLLISGNGRGFCAGQDLNDRKANNTGERSDLGYSVEHYYNPLARAIMSLEKPVVCAVNGVAAGAGANIAFACDIILAAESASFIEVFCNIGLIPDTGGTWNLPRAIGLPRAKALALLGEKLSATRAAEWGLIWRCVTDDKLLPEAGELARDLATKPTRALARSKQLLNESFSTPLQQQLENEKYAMRELGFSNDYAEGVSAFLEKRKPKFKGN